jgi:hypothetical protein
LSHPTHIPRHLASRGLAVIAALTGDDDICVASLASKSYLLADSRRAFTCCGPQGASPNASPPAAPAPSACGEDGRRDANFPSPRSRTECPPYLHLSGVRKSGRLLSVRATGWSHRRAEKRPREETYVFLPGPAWPACKGPTIKLNLHARLGTNHWCWTSSACVQRLT